MTFRPFAKSRFLWVTGSRLDFGIETLKEWGFKYSTVGFVWCKITQKAIDLFNRIIKINWCDVLEQPILDKFLHSVTDTGPGYYTSSNAEFVLIGVRGSMPPEIKMTRQFIFARRGKHSAKPESVQLKIESMYPSMNMLEMFARRHREFWTCCGNELSGLDIREELKQIAEREG
jgi:N6-adenosine-specific RNA methylase IME4